MGLIVRIVKPGRHAPDFGTRGLVCQLPGCCATVSTVASATGGIRPGGLIETDRG